MLDSLIVTMGIMMWSNISFYVNASIDATSTIRSSKPHRRATTYCSDATSYVVCIASDDASA